MFLKNRNIISKIERSKVTDYAALIDNVLVDSLLCSDADVHVLHQIVEDV